MDTNKFDLIMLSGKCLPHGPFSNFYEDVFAVWKKTWMDVFNEVGSPHAFNADCFFRAEAIPVIRYEGEVVAFFIASTYSLQPSVLKDHSYFSIFPETATARLTKEGVRNVMSYEFMTVLPTWRKAKLGFPLSGVMAELGIYIRNELGCDGSVGVARIQHKIDEIAHGIGGFTLAPEVRRGNLVCEIVGFLPKLDRPTPHADAHKLATSLWERRTYIDKYGRNAQQPPPAQVAA